MLEIDGSRYSGSGAIVRQAIAFAALTGNAVHIVNIRVRRPKPGLRRQHVQVVEADPATCGRSERGSDARVAGNCVSAGQAKQKPALYVGYRICGINYVPGDRGVTRPGVRPISRFSRATGRPLSGFCPVLLSPGIRAAAAIGAHGHQGGGADGPTRLRPDRRGNSVFGCNACTERA